MANNKDFNKANKNKNDEFYTQLTDIEKELKHYKAHFKDKIVFCNCDDPEYSNFWKYFYLNFEQLGLKKLIATHYETEKPSYKLEYDGTEIINTPLEQNGDFRSPECIEILEECDIVCTNPPFSLFREYIALLQEYKKKFLVLGNMNAITYKEIFPLIQNNKIWTGYGFNMSMIYKTPYPNYLEANRKFVIGKGYNPDEGYVKVPAISWYTNLDISKIHEELTLYKQYKTELYPKYVNFDAIEVSKVNDIPEDYYGIMGVPITFIDKYNPEQFEIIGNSLELCSKMSNIAKKGEYMSGGVRPYIKKKNGKYKYKRMYDRIFIKRKGE